MKESAIRKMGGVLAQGRDIISFAPGYPAPETFPWDEFQEIARELLSGRDGIGAAVRADARLSSAARGDRRRSWRAAARRPRPNGCSSRPDRSRGSTSSRACCSIRATSILVELPTYTGAITAFRNVQAEMVGVPQEADGIDLDALDDDLRAAAARGTARPVALRRAQLPEPDRAADRPRQARSGCSSGPSGATCCIVEDDPYRELYFEDSAAEADVRPIKADDAGGRVIYLSSFSKTLAPGYRVAWIDAPAPLAAKLEMAKQAADLCTGALDQRDRLRGLPARRPRSPAADAARALPAQARRDGGGAARGVRRRA